MHALAGESSHNRSVRKQADFLRIWVSEHHKCEGCGKTMKEYYGSGRFCSEACARKYSFKDLSDSSKYRRNKNSTWKYVSPEDFTPGEEFWKSVLESNGINFMHSYRVSKKYLGLSDRKHFYTLDFYLPEIKADLEVDGQQHKILEYHLKDLIKSQNLINSGFIVYRVDYSRDTNEAFLSKEIDDFLEWYNNSKKF
jgi:hypothetical protein